MSEHVDAARSLFLVALPSDDEERLAAEAHAARCEECAQLLAEGRELLGVVDEGPSGAPIDPVLRAQIRERVLGESRSRPSIWAPLWLFAMLLASLGMAWLDGRADAGLGAAEGVKCVRMEILLAVVPFALSGWLMLREVIAPQPLTLAATTMAGGLVGQVLLRSMCHAGDGHAHLLVFHVGGVLLSALLGYLGHRVVVARLAR